MARGAVSQVLGPGAGSVAVVDLHGLKVGAERAGVDGDGMGAAAEDCADEAGIGETDDDAAAFDRHVDAGILHQRACTAGVLLEDGSLASLKQRLEVAVRRPGPRRFVEVEAEGVAPAGIGDRDLPHEFALVVWSAGAIP